MALTERDFTPELCAQLVQEHGGINDAAEAIASQCASERYPGRPVAWRTVRIWISRHAGPRRLAREEVRASNPSMGMDLSRPSDPERLNRIDDLLDRANVPLEAIGAIKATRLKAYGGFYKGVDDEGNPTTVKVPLYSTTIDIMPPIPDFPVVDQAPPSRIIFRPAPRILRKTKVAIVYSDAQIDFLRDLDTDELEPTHDPLALEVAEQITADVDPDEQDWIGDWMDWQAFSRWPKHPEQRRTLQQAINAGHNWKARLIAAARRKTKRLEIGSNHGYRPEKFLLEYNLEAVGVKRANAQPDEWPVFSEQYLLRYDELGVEFSGQYPGGEYYLTDDLVLMHAPPKRLEMRASVIHGHTHKITRTPAVTHGFTGRKTHSVYDIGCLCQVGTTSNKRRLMVTRVPSDRGRTDWLQGIAVVSIVEGHGSQRSSHAVEQIEIIDGWALFRGKEYEARSLQNTMDVAV